jgi:hypothetical protein
MSAEREQWIVCPRCECQRYDRGTCGLCGSIGTLDGDGDPLTVENVRRALSWLRAYQGNFSEWVSEGEPLIPHPLSVVEHPPK